MFCFINMKNYFGINYNYYLLLSRIMSRALNITAFIFIFLNTYIRRRRVGTENTWLFNKSIVLCLYNLYIFTQTLTANLILCD